MSVHAVHMTPLMVMSLEERWVHAQAGEWAHVILGEGSFKIHFACDRQPGALDFDGSTAVTCLSAWSRKSIHNIDFYI